jgi:hypothetical protein
MYSRRVTKEHRVYTEPCGRVYSELEQFYLPLPSVRIIFQSLYCRLFREIFRFTQNVLNERFPERTPQITSFIFFHYICPVLVNPVKYGIIEEVPSHALTGLVNTSKLLKDVALNSIEKWQHDPLISQFIEKNHPAIAQHMKLILVITYC